MDVYGPFQIDKIHRLEDYLSILGIVLVFWKITTFGKLNHAMKWKTIRAIMRVKEFLLKWLLSLWSSQYSNVILRQSFLYFLAIRINIEQDVGDIWLIKVRDVTCWR